MQSQLSHATFVYYSISDIGIIKQIEAQFVTNMLCVRLHRVSITDQCTTQMTNSSIHLFFADISSLL